MEDSGTASQVLDASNRFYTLIPHDFGMKKPPMLDTKEIIQSKTEMLDNLLEIEVGLSGTGSFINITRSDVTMLPSACNPCRQDFFGLVLYPPLCFNIVSLLTFNLI